MSQVFLSKGYKVRNSAFVCHSEGATRSDLMLEKKIFPNMLIETAATEESLFPSQDQSSDPIRT